MNSTTLQGLTIQQFSERVRLHLLLNCLPPVNGRFTQAAIEAIAAGKDDDYGRGISTPTGTVRAGTLIQRWNLEGFIDTED